MKSFPKILAGAAVAIGCVAGLRAELNYWTENIDSASRLEKVFFGAVRRPPKETREALTRLIANSPSDAELYSLRALEAEQQLDFTAAEADWKKYIQTASDKGAARVAMADFYHRRLRSGDELNALALAATERAPESDKLLPASRQRRWKIYERLIQLVDEQRLDPVAGMFQYNAWIARYPAMPELYRNYFKFAMEHGRYDFAGQIGASYEKAFPKDQEFPIAARAEVAARIGTPEQALAIYESSFRPLWPAGLVKDYFDLLTRTDSLRVYLERARAGVAANPTGIENAARLFYYWQQENDAAQAGRALAEFRERKNARKSPWTAEELLTLGRLYESIHNYDEAARNYYTLYSVARSDDGMAEAGLGSLARLLLSSPEQPIHFGSGNLSLDRDVATMDPHPGFLNGVLSLLLNDTDPPNREAMEEQFAGAYFRRARAAELVSLYESRFPNSSERAGLRERVIESYAIYGASDGVIRAGAKFLADFPDAPDRTAVAMRMADAYARTNQTEREFATYDALLRELSKRAEGVPLGALVQAGQADSPRSPDYARVLDRYVARLVSLKRVPDALALYRREIDRNPDDPGLYDTLAAFLEQNRLGAQIEQVYRQAIARFPDHTWEHKLARWYLRQRRQADVETLTRGVVRIFSGTQLETYFREIVNPGAPLGPALYLQLNLFAHQRFPHNLSFVHNLLNAYTTAATRDDAAYEALLRAHWYDAEDLRLRFFERLSRTGRLNAELSLARTANAAGENPAALRTLAEGEAWRGHFEAAAPMFLALETSYPADRTIGRRSAAVYRSLGTIEPKLTDTAIGIEEKFSEADPRDRGALTNIGEMEAERDRFDRAATAWNKLAEIEPAKPDSYLEAATVFWDYYRYSDALRLIELGRQRLKDPALYAYQEGAIYENERDYRAAVSEYAIGAIASPAGSEAERRLIALARRPAVGGDAERLTDNLVSARNPRIGALNLRIALLRNQNRRDDLEKLLLQVAARTTSTELLATIEGEGQIDGFPKARQAAMEREIAMATDPVERMRLRLGLARFYEGQGQIAEGARAMDALYAENPAVLGIVRAAVDYYWRNRNPRRAVDVLEEAAGRAAAGYRDPFLLEAARKSIESGDYARARGLAARLLAADPNRAEYAAVMAETYARQRDDRGLRAFYDGKIRALAAAHRLEDAAGVRRALIPVLTRMKDFSGGVDQYIEILNRYPEDEGLAREAAAYASRNGVQAKLREYYTKAAADSPKDFRWPMVLGRIETGLEDYPAAIAWYSRASAVRPERVDLLTARFNLEERTLRFEAAAATAAKLYELTYRNPQWMEKLAEMRAREGRTADAVEALRRAWIEGREENAQGYFRVAATLESWSMLADARRFAEEGLKRPHDLGFAIYARILMRERQFDVVLKGLATMTDDASMPAIREIGSVVARYYSPGEKVAFGAALATDRRRIEIAESAGLEDLEAKWLFERMMADPAGVRARPTEQKLIQIQHDRLQFGELGTQLETFDRALAPAARRNELMEAAQDFRASSNAPAELRVLRTQNGRAALNGPLLERYCQLLMAHPQEMVAAIGGEARSNPANAMLNYVVEHGSASVIGEAIAARGLRMGPLWTKAYTGLGSLWLFSVAATANEGSAADLRRGARVRGSNAAAMRDVFPQILGEMTIGPRIGKPVDRAQKLAGDIWFYYGGRYGEYLDAMKQAGAEDYLPAMVEAAPGQSNAYFTLAEYDRNAGKAGSAAVDYVNALELNPARADAHDRLAAMAAKAGQNDEALQQWRLALAAFTEMMNRPRVPQRFWGDSSDALRHIGDAKMLAPLRGDIDQLLRLYIRRNGAFEAGALLEAAFEASGDIAWIGDLSRAAADPVQFLSATIGQPWIPEQQKGVLYERVVEAAQAQLARSFGEQKTDVQGQLWNWQIAWARYLLNRKQNQRAGQIVSSFPEEARKARAGEIITLEIRVAARTGRLAAQLARYGEDAPVELLRNAAAELKKDGDAAGARRVLELVYERDLNAGKFDAANFLGLAEIRLEEKNTVGAMALLRRAALVSGDAFSTLDASAGLLERTGHAAEAAEFLAELAKAEPWNADARERLAAAKGDVNGLAAVAKSADAAYGARAAAAIAIGKLKGPALEGSGAELELLSSSNAISEADANRPYFYAARLQAAAGARDAAARERILLAAIAVRPEDRKREIFRAALEARDDAMAIAIARRLLPAYIGETVPAWETAEFISGLAGGNPVEVARGVGQAFERLGNLAAAISYYQLAQRIEPEARTASAIVRLRAQVELNAKNEARRPVVSDNLEQDRLVRPKVGAR